MKKLHRGWLCLARIRIPLSGFLLTIVVFTFAFATVAEGNQRTFFYSNLSGNTTNLKLSNPTGHLILFPAGSPDSKQLPNFGVAARSTTTIDHWYLPSGAGRVTVEIPDEILAQVELVDDRGNAIRFGPAWPATFPIQILDLVAGGDNRSYVAVSGDVAEVRWYAGSEDHGAAVVPLMTTGQFGVIPVPLGVDRVVVFPPPNIGIGCGLPTCPTPTIYLQAWNARQSGRYELNNPMAAVAVTP